MTAVFVERSMIRPAIFLSMVFIAASLAVGAAVAPAAQPSRAAAARSKELKAAIDSFELQLVYHGDQDKPYYRLTLAVPGVVRKLEDPFDRYETLTKEQAEKIIDHLTTDGFLDKAMEVGTKEIPAPPAPCYTMSVFRKAEGGRQELLQVLGWEMTLLKRLDSLRAVLDGDAAKSMDLLLGRMSGHRKEWEKTQRTDAIERLRERLAASRLWQNGPFPIIELPPTASTEEVLTKVFELNSFDQGKVKTHKTLKEREIQIPGSLPDRYTAVVVQTDLGEKVVLLKHQGGNSGWWSRVYESDLAAPPDAKVVVDLVLDQTPLKDGATSVSATVTIKNPGNTAVRVQSPENRRAVTFFITDTLGNVVRPEMRGKADPAFQEIEMRPGADLKHKFEKLEFVTGSAWVGYDLKSGETYHVVAVYRPKGAAGPGFASDEQTLVVK